MDGSAYLYPNSSLRRWYVNDSLPRSDDIKGKATKDKEATFFNDAVLNVVLAGALEPSVVGENRAIEIKIGVCEVLQFDAVFTSADTVTRILVTIFVDCDPSKKEPVTIIGLLNIIRSVNGLTSPVPQIAVPHPI
jgi:hypothetical protein